jgi:hypothetical protein
VYHFYTSLFYPLLLKAVLTNPIEQRRIQINRRTAMDKKHDRPVEGQEVPKMEDFIKSGKETREFARDGYLDSFKMPFSLWEGYLKFLNAQIKLGQNFQQDCVRAATQFLDRFPSWNGNSKAMNGNFESFAAFHKEYVDLVTDISKRLMKGTLEGMQKNFIWVSDFGVV